MNDIVKEKKSNFIMKKFKTLLIISLLLVALFTLFGIFDFFRTKSGKKPIFIYHTLNVSSFDVEVAGFQNATLNRKQSSIYYGLGYKVLKCDIDSEKYTFIIGNKEPKPCYTSLTCKADERGSLVLGDDNKVSYDENDKDNYEYTFFEDKLVQVSATMIRPIASIENIETASLDIKNFYDKIPGCAGMGKIISEDAYETKITCALPKMSKEDIESYLPIRTKELLNYTREEIIEYHNKDLTCE